MFRDLVNRYATPFTTGLFVVSLVSGVALFFHVGAGAFHGMHEWLSMVLILPFGLHLWKNWLPILSYLKRGWLLWPIGVSVAAALVFAVPSIFATGGGNPQTIILQAIGNARVADLAAMLKVSPQEVEARLTKAGLSGAKPEATLADAAKAAGKETRNVVFAVVVGH